jgi:predicted AlkP superfamily phosphohydrolase/phosphomutase
MDCNLSFLVLKGDVMKRYIAILMVYIALFLLFFVYCGKNAKERAVSTEEVENLAKRSNNKVFLLGLDGATFDIIVPMVRNGELPNIEKLMQNGSYGNLTSIEPMLSPTLWTTILTGKKVEKHGIKDYTVQVEGQYQQVPVGSGERKSLAIWNITSIGNKTSAFLAFWASHPAEKVNGIIITDRFSEKDIKNAYYPPSIQDEVKPYIDISDEEIDKLTQRFTNFPFDKDFKDKYEPRTDNFEKNKYVYLLRHHLRLDLAMFRTGAYIVERYAPDVVGIYIKGIDGVSHLFWKYMDPLTPQARYDNITEEDRQYFRNVITEYYRWVDEMIGLIMPVLEGYQIIIVSDHGFGPMPDRTNYDMNALLTEMGLARFDKGELILKESVVYSLPADWSNKRNLRLNIAGREKGGIVKSGETQNILKKICDSLSSIKAEDGRKLFTKVESKGVQFGKGADIEIEFNTDIKPTDIVIIGDKKVGADRFIVSSGLSGDHRINGIIIMNGSSIKRTIIENASVVDVTPTILALLGFPVGEDMDGKVLLSAITDEFLKNCPVMKIPTYEGMLQKDVHLPVPISTDREKIEELRGLGYIH